jgi:dTDP-4-dehydrorhamnose reductase
MTASDARTRVWLVGASGMLGSVLAERLNELDVNLATTDRELDIGEREQVLRFAAEFAPELIVNAAAHTRVDDAEREEAEAFRVNAEGPLHLAEAARKASARFLHFSTDYVFAGDADVPYVEGAPTGPIGAYGRSKLAGEQRVLEHFPAGSTIVRTSWLFGPNGNNFVKTMVRLLREREELRVVADQSGRPTYTRDLARASLALAGVAEPAREAGVYHFANSEATTWYGLTVAIHEECLARWLALKATRIVPVRTDEFPRPARRPAYSVLDTSKVEAALAAAPRSFRAALNSYLDEELLGAGFV